LIVNCRCTPGTFQLPAVFTAFSRFSQSIVFARRLELSNVQALLRDNCAGFMEAKHFVESIS
jgi:hypothetical protein